MEVKITFRTPARVNGQGRATVHQRTLEAIPQVEAEQMAEDFVQYRSDETKSSQCRLYRYQSAGKDILVALDFTEIIALTARET